MMKILAKLAIPCIMASCASDDAYITTPIVKPHYADVRIRTTVNNKTADSARVKVEQVILNPEGKEVAKSSSTKTISAGTDKDIEVTIPLTDPLRWDIESPNLYTAVTNIYNGNRRVDRYTTPFGIRTIRFTPNNGFI
jgi:beta-galactosidase